MSSEGHVQQAEEGILGGRCLRITAVGDLMLGRTFEQQAPASADQLLHPSVLDALDGDVVTGNLECLLTTAERRNPHSAATFKADVHFAAPLLRRFDVLSLANNHINDFLDPGIQDTLDALERLNVLSVGVGRTREEALRPAIVRAGEQKVAVFGMATVVNLVPEESEFVVARPGTAAEERIREVRGECDCVVVHLHAGGGDLPFPAPEVRSLHSRLKRAGADIVFGHHPHCIQGWEETGGGASFFSLGDFVFDRLEDGRDTALLVRVTRRDRDRVEVVPVVRDRTDLSVHRAEGALEREIFAHLARLNAALSSGESDRLYLEAYGPRAGRLLFSLRNQFRIGGTRAVVARLRRVGIRRAWTLLHAMLLRVLRKRRPSRPRNADTLQDFES